MIKNRFGIAVVFGQSTRSPSHKISAFWAFPMNLFLIFADINIGVMMWYVNRKKFLDRFGYSDYSAYLASGRWQGIRKRVLKRCNGICEVCGIRQANQVHHRSYSFATMMGKDLDYLVGCCRDCHENAEFNAGWKTSPAQANSRMGKAARARGSTLRRQCLICCNPTKKSGKHSLCGRCKRDIPQISPDVDLGKPLTEEQVKLYRHCRVLRQRKLPIPSDLSLIKC